MWIVRFFEDSGLQRWLKLRLWQLLNGLRLPVSKSKRMNIYFLIIIVFEIRITFTTFLIRIECKISNITNYQFELVSQNLKLLSIKSVQVYCKIDTYIYS